MEIIMKKKRLVAFLLVFVLFATSLTGVPATAASTISEETLVNTGVTPSDVFLEGEFSPDTVLVQLRQDNLARFRMPPEAVLESLDVSFTEYRSLNPSIDADFAPMAFSQSPNLSDTIFALTIDTEEHTIEEAIAILNNSPAVLRAEPDILLELFRTPNDPRFSDLWGMEAIDALGAWEITTGSRDVVVAVIDSGIAVNHPDFWDGAIGVYRGGNLWENPLYHDPQASCRYSYGRHGFDFLNNTGVLSDTTGHGTHVAGTIGAVGNNGIGVTGVAWNVQIATFTIFGSRDSQLSYVIEAINFADQMGIPIINASWGTPSRSEILHDVIENYHGIFIAAAGNSGGNNDASPIYPASFDLPNIIAVAASDRANNRPGFSNFGRYSVDIAAPGVNILSTHLNGRYVHQNGTSMAAPHVSGVAALILSEFPDLRPFQVRQAILDGATPLTQWDGVVRSGALLNARGALDVAATMHPCPPVTIDFWFCGNGGTPAFQTGGFAHACLTCDETFATVFAQITEPVQEGYIFLGWFTAPSGGKQILFTDAIQVPQPTRYLYAQWEAIVIPVIGVNIAPASNFQLDVAATRKLTATVVPANATNQNVTWSSSNLAVATVTENGLVFGVSAGNATITVIAEDGGHMASVVVTTVEAAIITHTVTFALNDGTGDFLSVAVTDGETVSRPSPDPTRASYKFTDWFTEATGEQLFDFNTPITGDVTVYAQWKQEQPTPTSITITVDSNRNVNVTASESVTYRVYGARPTDTTGNIYAIFPPGTDRNDIAIDLPSGWIWTFEVDLDTEELIVVIRIAPVGPPASGDGRPAGSGAGGGGGGGTTPPSEPTTLPEVVIPDPDHDLTPDHGLTSEHTVPRPLPFIDVATTAWYYNYVRTVWENSIFQGTAYNQFSPQMSMTRAMFVQALANMEGVDLTAYGTATASFNDVSLSAWYFAAVEWAASQGIVQGVGNDNFASNAPITREQMAAMLYRYIQIRGIEIPANQTIIFADHDAISYWAVNAVEIIQAAGIITGRPNGNFDPLTTATRAEVATIFARFLGESYFKF